MQSINETSGNNTGMVAGVTNYTYDGNGNELTQTNTTNTGQNKTFTYNLLNLPQTVVISTGTMTYTYDATGNKLRRNSPASGTTEYIAGIEYDAGNLSFVQTEEGKAVLNGAGVNYTYYLGDNLGNTRVTFETKTGSAVQIQHDNYYPFGMEINTKLPPPPTAKNEYLYNKKELQEELQQYDYGARFYDPVIARWNVVDHYAEKYNAVSPYNYVVNNPIKNTDMKGDTIVPVGTADQIKRINSALAVVAITNPDEYNSMQSAVQKFTVDIEDMNPNTGNNQTGSVTTLSYEGTTTTDNMGEFSPEYYVDSDLKQTDPKIGGSTFTAADPNQKGARIPISEQQANEKVDLKGGQIKLDSHLGAKELARTIAHELGHGSYALNHKAVAAFLPQTPLKGHEKGNPTGQAATNAEKKFDKNYKDAKKKLKEDEKKTQQ